MSEPLAVAAGGHKRSMAQASMSAQLFSGAAAPLLSGLLFLLLFTYCSGVNGDVLNVLKQSKKSKALTHKQGPHPRSKSLMKRQWGVEVLFVRQTAAGYMLEFRYKVLDPVKSKLLFERQIKPMLIHAKSGAELVVPTPAKTGALRNSNPPLKDHTYWMFFANPGKLVQVGDIVSIKIGDFIATNLVVK